MNANAQADPITVTILPPLPTSDPATATVLARTDEQGRLCYVSIGTLEGSGRYLKTCYTTVRALRFADTEAALGWLSSPDHAAPLAACLRDGGYAPRTIPADGSPVPPAGRPDALPEWLERQALRHQAIGTANDTWLAERLTELAQTARWLQAESPAEYDGRLAVQERDRERRLWEGGYAEAQVDRLRVV